MGFDVGGDLGAGADHADLDFAGWLFDEVVSGVGGVAICDDLYADVGAGGDDVDDGLALFVGFDLEIAFVFAVLEGAEDYGGVGEGLAVVVAEYLDLDVGGLGGGFVLAAAAGAASS